MGQKWILDVLADLESFAAQNDLPAVAERLRETVEVALHEVSNATPGERAYDNNQRCAALSAKT